MNHRRLEEPRVARAPLRLTREQKHWKKYLPSSPTTHHGPVTRIHFSSSGSNPHEGPLFTAFGKPVFAATASTRVTLYDSDGLSEVRSFARFGDIAYGGSVRRDARLVCAGGEEGIVRVFDARSRSVIAKMNERKRLGGEAGAYRNDAVMRNVPHGAAVRVTGFLEDNVRVVSAAEDGSLAVWDLAAQVPVFAMKTAHADYVRAHATIPSSVDLVATGSYDHKVRVWDVRAAPNDDAGSAGACAMECDHGSPVESIVVSPSGSLIFTSGQGVVKVWDLLTGMREPIAVLSGHQKTVTSLALCLGGSRLMTGSLDKQMKIYDVATMECVHSISAPEPILSLAVSPDDSRIVAGHPSGLMTSRKRAKNAQYSPFAFGSGLAGAGVDGDNDSDDDLDARNAIDDDHGLGGIEKAELDIRAGRIGGVSAEARRAEARGAEGFAGTSKFFTRGKSSRASADDHLVASQRRAKLQPYDRFLKRFRYADALDAALETKRAAAVCAVVDELMQRDVLGTAIGGRDADGLVPLLSFLLKNVTDPRYSRLLVDATNAVLDVYAAHVGSSPEVDEIFLRLKNKITMEVAFQGELVQMAGALDMLMAASVM